MFLLKAWYDKAPWLRVLLPLAWLFRVLAALRRTVLLRVAGAQSLPIIVIGNITLGGTGKTPATIALVRALQAAGYRPGVVSRGFGARPPVFPYRVNADDSSTVAGDEPLVLLRNVDVPVVLDPRRRRAAQWLAQHTDCDVIVSDDGLQHYWLRRNFEIVMVDGERGLANGYCLPAGPLREPPSRLTSADHVVINGEDRQGLMPDAANTRYNQRYSRLDMQAKHWVNVHTNKPRSLQDMKRYPLHAIAGIGNPQRFFGQLAALGYDDMTSRAFPDHHRYSIGDLTQKSGRTLVMTEKDAVKCRNLAGDDSWYLAISPVLAPELIEQVLAMLQARAAGGAAPPAA